jgi:hypothetical protein
MRIAQENIRRMVGPNGLIERLKLNSVSENDLCVTQLDAQLDAAAWLWLACPR